MEKFLFLLPFLLSPVSASADQIPRSDYTSGAWWGAGYTNHGGEFSHCAISSWYESGDLLVLSVTGDAEVAVGIESDRLGMIPGSQYPVSIRIDRNYSVQGIAEAVDETYAVTTLPGFTSSMDAIRFGNLMVVEGNGFRGEYLLTGTAVALERTRQCAIAHLEYEEPETLGVEPRAEASENSNLDRTFLFQAATQVISELGVSDFRYFTEAEMVENGANPAAVYWYSDSLGLMGGTFIEPANGTDLRSSDSTDAEFLASACGGDFATSSRDLSGYSVPAREVRLVCLEQELPHEVYLTKLLAGDFVLYSELRYFESGQTTSERRDRFADAEAVAATLANFVIQ